MTAGGHGSTATVLVAGHESARGADLAPLLDVLPGATVVTSGRSLHDAVAGLLDDPARTVAVLPVTWGRDPVMVAEAAKTLRWAVAGRGPGRVALCAPLGTPDHLVAWLRRAATQVARRGDRVALVVAAHAADPFDDAELYRIAHLVRVHGAVDDVEVACVADAHDVDAAARRARLLGAQDVVVVPAGFQRTLPPGVHERVELFGPLVSDQALARVVRDRVGAALQALQRGDDGIEAGLLADHGHGYAHSHAFEEGAEQGHAHPHTHPHAHAHPHSHGHAHTHAHGSEPDPVGGPAGPPDGPPAPGRPEPTETPSVRGASPVEV